jgi:hypothetical protein
MSEVRGKHSTDEKRLNSELINLKNILCVGVASTGIVRFGIANSERRFPGLHKKWGIPLPVEKLLASIINIVS